MNYLSCDAVHICKKITILYHSYLLISLISELEIKKGAVTVETAQKKRKNS